MYLQYNKNLIQNAKKLRKNMTKQERHLWYDFLKTYPVKIVRQRTIMSYIVDFYCSSANLAIEIDGSQHYDEDTVIHDTERTDNLKTLGLNVIRVSNHDVDKNFNGVCEYIHNTIQKLVKEKQ